MCWDSYADEWDEDEGARAYSRAAFESLTRLCAERSIRLAGARVCDFGCGTGLLTEKLAPVCASVVAVDTSPRMIGRLRLKIERQGLTNVHTTTEPIARAASDDTEIVGHPFDVVVCSSVCAFLDDYPDTAGILVRLLRPGGVFVQWDWELDANVPDPFGLTREQVEEALVGSGLEAIEVASAFEVPMEGTTVRPLMGVGQVPVAD